ncbi:MAG: caspase family protein [Timaviella obliquedivisa GSE-PSE-MK23-08B]|jgi:WD40 repeat protein|nr:caspase family protein [Timaviella obliquedivisa GSE-PSE-MK23-08B]
MSRDALIVGINTYQYLPSLQAPAKDAEAIAQQLHSYGEFRVHRLPEMIQSGKSQIGQKTPVTLQELETALINLFKPKGNNPPHTALFYFSGHGIQRDAGIQEGYLAVSDANPDKGFCGLSLFWLRRLLQESPVRQRIVILDCCHSGELLNFLEADPGAQAGTDRLFMAASKEYETAYESLESPYSVFTQALVTGLDPNRVEAGVVTNHSLTDWVNHSLKSEIQQPLFESSGSEIILTRGNGGQPSPIKTVKPTHICPYRGLEFFDEAHAEFFFGREELTAQLIDQLKTERFAAVTGASGSGKSSLLRAGVISRLQQERTPTGANAWKIKLLTPTEHPLKSLAAAFIDPELSELERAEQLRRAEAFLQDGGMGLAQLVRASLAVEGGTTGLSPKERPQLLLVIDQFEEVFTLPRGIHVENERQKFFDCLAVALEMVSDYLSLAIVVRADFIGKCSLYEGLARKIEQHRIMVSPLKYEQIKATIVRPAQKVGLVCEPNLVYTMLMDIIGAPGELPLLQYTLLELWEHRRTSAEGGVVRLTLDTYRELGGVRGTLQKQATEIFSSLTLEEQAVAKRIFLALTQLGEGTEDTRRRVVKSELVSPIFPSDLIEQVLEKLVAAKLVITNQEMGGEQTLREAGQSLRDVPKGAHSSTSPLFQAQSQVQEVVDVTHEALIRNWSLLKDWINENRDMLRRQRRIESTAQEWDAAGQSAQGEYLLQGLRLRDAEDFIQLYPQELSALAQQYVAVSQSAIRRTRRESRQVQIAVPSVLLATLAMVLSQYYGTMQTQAKQHYQLQIATARERALIAQTVLQNSNSDPMVALLIGRLAAEHGKATYEMQASIRSALKNLRLQLELRGHEDSVNQMVFSPENQKLQTLATASADGTIRLWSLNPQTVYNTVLKPLQILTWAEPTPQSDAIANVTSVAYSPDGLYVAAIAENSSQVKVWSVESGRLILDNIAGSAEATEVMFSPDGKWIVVAYRDQSISIWDAETGRLEDNLPQAGDIKSLQISPDTQFLLSTALNGRAQLWRLKSDPAKSDTQTFKRYLISTLSHGSSVSQSVFSPNGEWVATASSNGQAKLWNTATGKLLHTFEQKKQIPLGQLHHSNPLGRVNLNRQSLTQKGQDTTAQPVVQMKFSPNGQILVTTDPSHRVWLWDIASGTLKNDVTIPHTSQTTTVIQAENNLLSLSPDARIMATVEPQTTSSAEPQAAQLWDLQTGQEIATLPGQKGTINRLQFSPDGTYVATAAGGIVRFWSAKTGGELPTLKLTDAPVHWAMFLQGGAKGRIGQASAELGMGNKSLENPSLSLWGSDQPAQAAVRKPANAAINQMISIASNGQLQRWQILTDATARGYLEEPAPQIGSSALSEETKLQDSSNFFQWLMSFLRKRTQRLNVNTQLLSPPVIRPVDSLENSSQLAIGTVASSSGVASSELPVTNKILSGAVLSPDGQMVATANTEGWVELYQVRPNQSMKLAHRISNWRDDDQPINELSPIQSEKPKTTPDQGTKAAAVRQLAFSTDGQQLLGIADDLTVRVWDTQSGQFIQEFQGHTAAIQQAQFSPDGQFIVTSSLDRTARIWRVSSGLLEKELKHTGELNSARFSPDGEQVVAASWDGAKVWNARTGEERFLLMGHQNAVLDAHFSPDGRSIVTASADGTARLWETETGTELAVLNPGVTGEPVKMQQAFFSPDGQYIATLTEEGQIYLWAATWDMLLKLARDRSFRQLTPQECVQYLKVTAESCPKLPVTP